MPSPASESAAEVPILRSIIVPVYGNAPTLPRLLREVSAVTEALPGATEIVFVVDGSPDNSADVLEEILPTAPIPTQLLIHSRNFGSFAAIRTGMRAARGEFFAVMAADLQEPPSLMTDFFAALESGENDIAVGRREARNDPGVSSLASRAFWASYRRIVNRDIPPGGVDVFACNRKVAEQVLLLGESHSSLVGLLYWVGFRRIEVPYVRAAREEGKSGWTFKKKLRYLLDSVFSFTDLPIALLTGIGITGTLATIVIGLIVFVGWAIGAIQSTGYTPLMLAILFSAFVTMYGLGVVGSYVWRTYENSKSRPSAIVTSARVFEGQV